MNAITKSAAVNKYSAVIEFVLERAVFLAASAAVVYAGYRMFLL